MNFKLPDELIFIKNAKAIQKKSLASMDGKVCIITGATSGVGLEAAKRLARGGAHIVMVCRNREKAENVSNIIKNEFKVPVDIIIADFAQPAPGAKSSKCYIKKL